MDIDELSLCPICKNIPVNEREDFLNELDFKTKYYKKGKLIAQRGDIVKSLYILSKGSVKAEMIYCNVFSTPHNFPFPFHVL